MRMNTTYLRPKTKLARRKMFGRARHKQSFLKPVVVVGAQPLLKTDDWPKTPAPGLVCGHSRIRVFAPPDGAIRWQARIPDFIEQRAIADAQRSRRLLAVPMIRLEHLQNHFPLQFARRLTRQLLQRNWPIKVDFSIEIIRLMRRQIARDDLF